MLERTLDRRNDLISNDDYKKLPKSKRINKDTNEIMKFRIGNGYDIHRLVEGRKLIIGGVKFYERAEIKDCIAYLRIVYQNKDDLAFERIVNVPKRSIGDTSFKIISEHAKKNSLSLENSSKNLIELNKIKPKTKTGLSNFLNLLKKWRNDHFNKKIDHVKLLQIILDESGYSLLLKNKKDLENENRLENIKELLNAMKEFDNLESFLEHVSLAT